MEYNLEIFKSIIQHGRTAYPNIADPSLNERLKNSGVAPVTAHIEKLSLMGLIGDVRPILGMGGGMWIGYILTERGKTCADNEEEFHVEVQKLQEKPSNEVSNSVRDLVRTCRESDLDQNYKEDFIKTLDEIAICFENECYIATITLCGKILEICLFEMLKRNGVDIQRGMMIGKMLRLVRKEVQNEYLDPSLESISRIISKSRNFAVHYNERIPVPSRDQAIMVIFAMRDVVSRNISKQN
jgi:hypothetical protein